MPIIAEVLTEAWVKIAETLSTFVIVVILQRMVFFAIFLAVSIFTQGCYDGTRSQVYHVADVST